MTQTGGRVHQLARPLGQVTRDTCPRSQASTAKTTLPSTKGQTYKKGHHLFHEKFLQVLLKQILQNLHDHLLEVRHKNMENLLRDTFMDVILRQRLKRLREFPFTMSTRKSLTCSSKKMFDRAHLA